AENQYIYKFELQLTFAQQKIPSLYVNGNGKLLKNYEPIKIYNSGGNGNWPSSILYPQVIHGPAPDVPPTIIYLVVPGDVSWGTVKELPYFEVGLIVSNMADPEFVLENSSVELELPSGISLMSSN
ncbi:hypothetical protein, partial [Stenotrophomonas maltophilia group sp. RNC7]|uniref:hypothetical protein n=1 Tax=Stenotrophomonas maltophilia group sp. RNC7 TaxID=3071467 RepID=UPI0027E0DF7D